MIELRADTLPRELMDYEEVRKAAGMTRATFFRHLRDAKVPAGIKLGKNCTRWLRRDIEQWLADRDTTVSGVRESDTSLSA